MTDAELMEFITNAVRAELCGIMPVLADLVAQAILDRQAQRDDPHLSDFDRELARVVELIYRNQGRPATTAAVATRIGYSAKHTRVLLQDAERVGAVASIPRRGNRHSGRWIPKSLAA